MAVTCRLFLCVLASCILTGASSNTTGFLAPSATNFAKNGTSDVPNTVFGGNTCYDDCLSSFHDCNKDPTAFAECSSRLSACYDNCPAAKVTKNITNPISQNVSGVKSQANFAKIGTSDVPNTVFGGNTCYDDCLSSFHDCNKDPTAFAECSSRLSACYDNCPAAKVTKNITNPISQNVSGVKSQANFAKNGTSDVPNTVFGGNTCYDDCLSSFHDCNKDPTAFAECSSRLSACYDNCPAAKVTKNITNPISQNVSGVKSQANFAKIGTSDVPNTVFGGNTCYDDCLSSFHDCNKDPTAFAECSSRLSACYDNCPAAKVTKNITNPISQNVSGVKSQANFAKNGTSDVPNTVFGGNTCYDDCLSSFHDCNKDPTAFAECSSRLSACYDNCPAAKVTKNITNPISQNVSGVKSQANFAKNGTSDVPNTVFGGNTCYDDCLSSFHDCNKDPTAFPECSSRLSACYGNCPAAKVTKNITNPISQNVSGVKSQANFAKNSTSDVPNMVLGSSKFGGNTCYDDCISSFHDCNKDPTAFAECSSRLSACYNSCA
eukprot:Skav220947  [mRNA]  locus=scaffold2381:143605:145248:- [translate_table: standard]